MGSSSNRPGFGGRRAPARPSSGSPRNIIPSAGAWPGGPRRGDRAAVPPGGATRWEEAASSDQTPRGEGRDHSWPKLGRREIGGPSRGLPKDLRSSSPPAARPGALISPAPSSGPLHRDRRKFTTKWAVSVNSIVSRPPGPLRLLLITAGTWRGSPESPYSPRAPLFLAGGLSCQSRVGQHQALWRGLVCGLSSPAASGGGGWSPPLGDSLGR